MDTKKKKRARHGTGSIFRQKNSPFFYIQYRHGGKLIQKSSKSTVKAEAQAMLNKLLRERDQGRLPTNQKVSYAQLRAGLLADYHEKNNKSLQTLADGTETIWGLEALDRFFGYKPATATTPEEPGWPHTRITTEAMREFRKQREAEGINGVTVNRSLALLRRMLNIALRERKIDTVPYVPMVAENPARKGFVTQEKFDKLLNALPKNLHPLILLLYWTGARLGEALSIAWNQVHLSDGYIELEADQTKSGEARILPLPDLLVRLLQEVEHREDDPVFDATNLRKAWAKACVAAGLKGLLIHDLRRSAIRNLTEAGVDDTTAMKISGHKTYSVFQRYNIRNKASVLEAMRKVQRVNGHGLPESK